MRKILAALLILAVLASGAALAEEENVDYSVLFSDLANVWAAKNKVNADLEALQDDLANDIAAQWDQVYLNADYRVYLHGTDDPSSLPIQGKHAFVVLGFQLQNGEMTDELKARCDAAAAAAHAFPDSILVCTGGATGENNPKGHTESGLMKDYLVQACGIAAGRIYTDEKAMTTVENALNTFVLLKAQGIEEITLVTSSYHQRRAHMLYYTLAAFTHRTEGYLIRLAGNFSNEAATSERLSAADASLTARQLDEMLRMLSLSAPET